MADQTDKTLVIRDVVPGITTFSIPFTRAGLIPIGGRTTAIKTSSSDVFVYVSSPLSPMTKAKLDSMGNVRWLVTPDGEHGMNIESYVNAYPQAQAIGVTRLKEQKPHIKWAGIFGSGGETQTYGFEPEITLHQVSSHVNHELVAIHHLSGTLIEADMLFNLPPTEQYSKSSLPFLFKLTGSGKSMSPHGALHGFMVGMITKDKVKIKDELRPINAATWDRIIPCHGDVIETGGKVAWNKLWAKYA